MIIDLVLNFLVTSRYLSALLVATPSCSTLTSLLSNTGKHVLANEPDIVAVDKKSQRAIIIDIAVPNDYNIASKEKEKVSMW